MKAYVAGKPLLSTTDWPSNVCSVVFFAGCNMRCRFCFNTPILEMDKKFLCDLADVQLELEEQKFLIDGVIASGGEPALQPKPLRVLAEWAHQNNLRFGLMNNGTTPSVLRDLLAENLLDYVAVDVKTVPEPKAYAYITQSKENILPLIQETVDLLKETNIHYEFRTTLVPQHVHQPDQISQIAEWVGSEHYVLQAFQHTKTVVDPQFRNLGFTSKKLAQIREFAQQHSIETRF